MANRIDFNVLHTRVTKVQQDLQLGKSSEAFAYVAMESILSLSDNEIEDSIVDGPQDRGIDAVYIEEDNTGDSAAIHLFQFKYTADPEKINHNFPGNEVDKILTIIEDIMSTEGELQNEVNPALWQKIKDIREVLTHKSVPTIILYFCGNMQPLASHEKKRIERNLSIYPNLQVEYYSIDRFVEQFALKSQKAIDAQIRFVGKEYFERSSGNIRAVIGIVSALDLIELLLIDKSRPGNIQEAIFEDNIRIYQGTKDNPINLSILETALDKEKNYEFVYLNNGITMTCDKIDYTPRHSPLVDLKNIQIVNGSQTSHALFEAYKSLSDTEKDILDDVLVLVRVYQTGKDIVPRIVETTNSQTVINSRDLKANDLIQRKLHTELKDKGYFYETKKNYYQQYPKEKRLDAQVVGQVAMSFYLGRPHEVKFRRREIFGKYYSEVFDADLINADNVLKPMTIFYYVENEKRKFQIAARNSEIYNPRLLFLTHASFFILYGMKLMIEKHGVKYSHEDINNVVRFYEPVVNILADMVEEAEKARDKKYSHNSFFRQKSTVNKLEYRILEEI